MSENKETPLLFTLPSLIFGEGKSEVGQGFFGMVDQFSHLTPDCDYDSKAKTGFIYKGNVFSLDNLVINQNYYSHMLAVSSVKENNLLIPLAGTHNGLFRGNKLIAKHNQGFFIPSNDRFLFETGVDELAGSLIITYDLARLNQTLKIMTGNHELLIQEESVRSLLLVHGSVNFKKLLFSLLGQIDGFNGNTELLKLNGFDDQFYRLLSMLVRPDYFLSNTKEDINTSTRYQILVKKFELYIEDSINKPIVLSEVEAMLGVTSRTLQYACQKILGTTPREYIRNKKLDFAYHRLSNKQEDSKIAALSYELGFSSQSRFTYYFKQRFGIYPSELKNKV